jgi:hypothetical protein
MPQALGVVHVLISSETAKHRLSQQTYQVAVRFGSSATPRGDGAEA